MPFFSCIYIYRQHADIGATWTVSCMCAARVAFSEALVFGNALKFLFRSSYSLESIGTSERFENQKRFEDALWKPKALWRRTLKNPKTHRTVTTTPRILCPETLLKSISLLYISVLYPYITYPSTFRSLNLHLNSTSTFFMFISSITL